MTRDSDAILARKAAGFEPRSGRSAGLKGIALRLVQPHPPEAVHISDLIRADISKLNWRQVHEVGDKQPPLDMADRVRRGWR